MKKILFILLILIPSIAFSKKVINSGHQSPVKFILYNQNEDSFFSLSEDGTLVIKKSDDEKISKRFFLSSNNITKMALSPTKKYFAIVETDSASQFYVSVWDWENERKLYSINLSEFPMDIGYSGNGNYIYVTSISSSPVKIFRSSTGASTTYLNKNKSFVDFVYIGSSEKTAFLYSSSGQLEIRELVTSKLLKTINTEKNLQNMVITPDKRYLIGNKDNTIYVIGRNDGKVYSKKVIPELEKFVLNNTTGEIVCYINNKFRKTLSTYQLVSGEFFDTSSNEMVVKLNIQELSAAYNLLLYSDSKGDIYKHDKWYNNTVNFVKNDILNIQSVSFIDDKALLSTDKEIFIFKSPFFTDNSKNEKRLTTYQLTKLQTPIISPIGSTTYNNNLLVWKNSIASIDIDTGETVFKHDLSGEIIDVKIQDNRLLVLDKNGIVKIIDLESNKETFSFKSPGFTSVAFYSETEIIGGVDKSHGGSLMILDLNTKETIPLKTMLDVVFNIIESNNSYTIYLAGLKNVNNKNQTYFIEYNILTKSQKILLKNSNEIFNSSFSIDEKNSIFTNIGTKSILKIDSSSKRIKPFQLTTNQTKSIKYSNKGIYTVNENKSLTIWNPTTGKKIIDLYLFNDSEWVAVTNNNISAFGSPGSRKYITTN